MSRELLTRTGLDLSVAVFLAEASEAAYANPAAVTAWAKESKFPQGATSFARSNVQGFWAVEGNVALIAFRGTQNIAHWLRNVRVLPWKTPWGMVHRGFLDGVNDVEEDLAAFAAAAKNAKHVWVTGHSLGGAMAVVASARLQMRGIAPSLYTFGQPKMCFNGFATRFAIELPGRYVRFVNQDDIVPRVPPFYGHFGLLKRIVQPGGPASLALEAARAAASPELVARVADASRVIGPSTMESAAAVSSAGIIQPLLIDAELPGLTEQQFVELQVALGSAEIEPSAEPERPPIGAQTEGTLSSEVQMEGFFPSVGDHAIAKYVELLSEIRDQEE